MCLQSFRFRDFLIEIWGYSAKQAGVKKYDISRSILQSWLISKFSESLMGPPPVVSEDFSEIENWLLSKRISSVEARCSAVRELLSVKTHC